MAKKERKLHKYLNSRQACEILNIESRGTLYGYIRKGILKAYKLGGNGDNKRHWRFKERDLEKFIIGQGSGAEQTESNKK